MLHFVSDKFGQVDSDAEEDDDENMEDAEDDEGDEYSEYVSSDY